MAETAKGKKIRVVVIGTDHANQRHQDTDDELEKRRAKFDQHLRKFIKEVDLVAEEAGDDTEVWKGLKEKEQKDRADLGELSKLFDKGIVDGPVGTIAKTIADELKVRHEDVDVDIRADESDPESIEKRSDAIAAKILDVLEDAERVLVIVGEKHRADIEQRLKEKGLSVKSFEFP